MCCFSSGYRSTKRQSDSSFPPGPRVIGSHGVMPKDTDVRQGVGHHTFVPVESVHHRPPSDTHKSNQPQAFTLTCNLHRQIMLTWLNYCRGNTKRTVTQWPRTAAKHNEQTLTGNHTQLEKTAEIKSKRLLRCKPNQDREHEDWRAAAARRSIR